MLNHLLLSLFVKNTYAWFSAPSTVEGDGNKHRHLNGKGLKEYYRVLKKIIDSHYLSFYLSIHLFKVLAQFRRLHCFIVSKQNRSYDISADVQEEKSAN